MAYRFTEKAQRDFDALEASTIENWGIPQAIDYIEGLLESCQLIAEFPLSGRLYGTVEDQEIRRFSLKYHIILYRIDGDDIDVLAIPHGRSDPEMFLKS